MSDDFAEDAAQYAALQQEIAKDGDPLQDIMGGNIAETPLDQGQVEEGSRQHMREHADILREAETENARQQRHAEVIRQTHGQGQQQQPTYEEFERQLRELKENDPIGYFENLVGNLYHQSAQHSQQAQEQSFWGSIDRSEAQAKAEISDYSDAIMHLEQTRWEELKQAYPDAALRARGYTNPDAVRLQLLNNDRIMCAQRALQMGRDPAQFYYDLACSRGWRSQRSLTPAESRHLAGLYDHSLVDERAGEAFDKAWDHAARLNRL